MADDKLGIEFGIKMDTRKFQQEISGVTNIIKRLSTEMSTLGAKARKSMEKYAKSLQNMVNVGAGGTPNAKRNKDGSFNKNSLKKAYSTYSKRAISVYTNEIQTMGSLVAKLNVALEPMVTNMALAQEIANKTNSAYMQSVNYQSQLNKKVENRLLSKKNELEAQLKNANLIKETKELQEKISEATKTNKVLEKEATKEKEKQEKLDRQKAKDQEKIEKAKQKELEQQNKLNQKTEKQVSLVTQLRRLFAGVYVIKRFASIFTDMVKLSGDWVENLNLFVVSFGQDFYKESLDWATDFSQRLGASVNEIVKLTANFRQLTSAIGYAQDTSDSLSRTLTSLAYDITSYYNLQDVETAYTKLSSGIFSGQVKTLRSLGIDVSAESITTYLQELSGTYSEFIGITNAGLDQSQKVLARTLLVMKSATNSFGDMSRSIETLANRQRVFIASLENLKLALGDLASDTISTLLAYMNGFIRAITTIIRVFKPLKETLDYEVGGTVLGALNEDAEEVQKNLNKLSFDKFETLTGGDESGGQLSVTEALTAELQKQIALYEQQASQWAGIDETANKVYKTIVSFVFPDAFDESTGKLKENLGDINPLLVAIGASLAFIVGLKIVSKIGSIINMLPALTKGLDEVAGVLGYFISTENTAWFKAFTKDGFSQGVQGLIKSLTGLKTALDFLVAHPIILIIVAVVALLTALYFTNEDFRNSVNHLFEAFKPLLDLLMNLLGTVLEPIFILLDGLMPILTGIIWLVGTGLVKAISFVMTMISPFVIMLEFIVKTFQTIFEFIRALVTWDFSKIGDIWKNWSSLEFTVKSAGSLAGYANGGSLDLGTQVWGMNEKGNPEFMFNAGGYDSVINADILEKAIAKGTESAIISSGLLASSNQELVVRGDRIDNDALARAIFPALQKESRRLGGNKL